MKISVVSPVYQGENLVFELVDRLNSALSKIGNDFEIILVEDGSPDSSWEKIEEVCKKYFTVKGIKLSRNFGQHSAIMAGLVAANGDWVVVMDCDLQDQPEEIINLYNKANEGFEIVVAKRTFRRDTVLKRFSSNVYTAIYNYMSDNKHDSSVANFGIYRKEVIAEVIQIQDVNKIFPLFVNWVGFNRTEIFVDHGKRFSGKSSYNFYKLLRLASNAIISFSNKPLKLVISFGLIISFISIIVGLIILYKFLNNEIKVVGYPSILLSIWFLFGITTTIIGVVGMYIGKIFEQTKNRPAFIINKKINC